MKMLQYTVKRFVIMLFTLFIIATATFFLLAATPGDALSARVEKLPLDKMIGNSFSSLFSNMDAKWLHVYERATLYGETLEIMDYSPEIDTNLKIICFPTFPGHCGCILFNADKMKSISEENHLVRLAAVALKSNPTI